MLKLFRRLVKLATVAGVIGAAVAAFQQTRSTGAQTADATAGGGDTWPEVPRRPND